jgi:aminocarboxymuconate-semialdehyde decarboxylase
MFPNLNIGLAHGGGTFPVLLGRIRHGARVRPEVRGTTANAPMDFAKRFYDFSLTHSGRTLRFLMDMAGCDRIMLGRDYPFDVRDRDPIIGVNPLVRPTQEDIAGLTQLICMGHVPDSAWKLQWDR